MNFIAKEILIIISVFFITLWLQYSDDKKYNNKRVSLYEKYKIPLFFSAIVGLLLNIHDIIYNTNINEQTDIHNQEIYIDRLYPSKY
jgi:hypothetical protein